MASFPLVSATGMLGSGFRPSLDKAISLGARMIGQEVSRRASKKHKRFGKRNVET